MIYDGLARIVDEFKPHEAAVEAFQARPAGRHDLVTCLDVLDKVEPNFLDAVLADAQRARAFPWFNPFPGLYQYSGLTPLPFRPPYWI